MVKYFTISWLLLLSLASLGSGIEEEVLTQLEKGERIYKSHPKEALVHLEEAMQMAEQAGFSSYLPRIYKTLGLAHYYLDNFAPAMQHYEQALIHSRALGDSVQVANVLHNISMIYRATYQFDKALQYANQVYKLDKYNQDEKGLGYTYNFLGLLHKANNDTLKAKDYFEKSLEIRQKINHLEGLGYTYLNLGNMAIGRHEYNEAEEYFSKAADIALNTGDSVELGKAIYSLGNVALNQKDTLKSWRNHLRSYHIRLQSNASPDNMLESLTALGVLESNAGHYARADSIYKVALIYAEQGNSLSFHSLLYNLMAKLALKQFDYENALKYNQKYHELREKAFDHERKTRFKMLESMYELEKAQKEVEQLRKDKKLAEKNAYLSRMFVISMVVILLLIIFSAIIFIRLKSKHVKFVNQKNQQLLEINKSLDHFVSIASHDLKAPLASSKGIIDIIRDSIESQETLTLLDMQEQSLSKLELLIRELLDYSRSSKLNIVRTTVNISKVIDDIKDNLRFEKAARKVAINADLQINHPVVSDPLRMKIILNNLISNAIRYQNPDAEKPYVDISVKSDNKQIKISVADNGVGIAPKHHNRIFDMFYKASTHPKSSGLGLYIVMESVRKIEGKIWFESTEGVGTTFYIELPNFRDKEGVNSEHPKPELLNV